MVSLGMGLAVRDLLSVGGEAEEGRRGPFWPPSDTSVHDISRLALLYFTTLLIIAIQLHICTSHYFLSSAKVTLAFKKRVFAVTDICWSCILISTRR